MLVAAASANAWLWHIPYPNQVTPEVPPADTAYWAPEHLVRLSVLVLRTFCALHNLAINKGGEIVERDRRLAVVDITPAATALASSRCRSSCRPA